MTLTPDDDLNETARQRTRDQIALLRKAFDDRIIVDTDDDADFSFVCASDHVLVNRRDVGELNQYFSGRGSDFHSDGGVDDSNQPPTNRFRRYVVPTRREAVPGAKGLLATLDELDRDMRPGLAVPDHVVHICSRPVGTQCPATEPSESGVAAPRPPAVTGTAGTGVSVVVIDTGWFAPQKLPWPHLAGVDGEPEPAGVFDGQPRRIRAYAGHGTFVAGVIRSMAPGATVYVLAMPVNPQYPGGGVLESDMVRQLDDALTHQPDLINLSAGCPTRHNRPARAFEQWWADVTRRVRKKEIKQPLLVASAGNNSSPWGFWPASFPWALGVGSLDRDGSVSDFSNYGDSADVYALGRNLVNAFPRGTYVCHEAPDRHDERKFNNWYARWSGTSFSAPLVTGQIAAAMSPEGAAVPTLSTLNAKGSVLGVGPSKRSLKMVDVPIVRGDLLVPQV